MHHIKPIVTNPFRRESSLRVQRIVETLPEVPVAVRQFYADREHIKSISPQHSLSDEEESESSSSGVYPAYGNNADSEEAEEPHAIEPVCPECEILRARIAELEALCGIVEDE